MEKLTFERLRETNKTRGLEWMGDNNEGDSLLFRAVEMGGEAGEVLDAVKKLERFYMGVAGGIEESDAIHDIGEELADVIICADRLADKLNINLDDAIVNKFNKTSDKHNLGTKL